MNYPVSNGTAKVDIFFHLANFFKIFFKFFYPLPPKNNINNC